MSWYAPSPPGGSTFTTSAPSSASNLAASGPAQKLDMSSTRWPARAPSTPAVAAERVVRSPSAWTRRGGPPAFLLGADQDAVRPHLVVRQPLLECVALGRGCRRRQQGSLPRIGRTGCKTPRHLRAHVIAPCAIGEPGQRSRLGKIETAFVVQLDQTAQFSPSLRPTQIDLHAPAITVSLGVQDRRARFAEHPRSMARSVKDRPGVEVEQRFEQRRLYVLSVAGGSPV